MCDECAGRVFGVGFVDLAYRSEETGEAYFLEYIETPIPTYLALKRMSIEVIFTGKAIRDDTVNLVFITRSNHGGKLNMGLRSHPTSGLTFSDFSSPEIHSIESLCGRIETEDFCSKFGADFVRVLRTFLYELAGPPCADHAPRGPVKRKMRA